MIYGEVTDPWASEVGAASAAADHHHSSSDVPPDDDEGLQPPIPEHPAAGAAPLACGRSFIDNAALFHGAKRSSFAILAPAPASPSVAINGGPPFKKMDLLRSKSGRDAAIRTAGWTLLNTILVVTASVVLYGLAVFAYILFYNNYLPDQLSSVPIHLQYGDQENPYGLASINSWNLKDAQSYDITVSLAMPRSPTNIDRGNFMVVLHLLDRAGTAPVTPMTETVANGKHSSQAVFSLTNPPPDTLRLAADRHILYTASRPALIPYTDPLVSLASRLLFMPYHILWPYAESARLDVPMAERVTFSASAIDGHCPGACPHPSLVYVELRSGGAVDAPLQVYSAEVSLTARLSGLRWFMLRHRYIAFATLSTSFWLCELLSATVMWAVLFGIASSKPDSTLTTPASPLSLTEDSEGGDSDGKGKVKKIKGKGKEKGKPQRDGRHVAPFEPLPTVDRRDEGSESDDESEGTGGGNLSDDHVWDVKKEEKSEDDDNDGKTLIGLANLPEMTPAIKAERDDDDDEGLGVGTSYDAGRERGPARRRKSRGRS